ncbi:phage/plasmid primase, P4 family, partial [Candidatus Magnetoovum chiemensis]
NKDPFSFTPFARHIYSANEIPRSYDKTYAYYRRWIIIPFEKRFDGKKADLNLISKLIRPTELSGLLNLAITGVRRVLKNHEFTERDSVKQALERYERDNDNVTEYLKDMCLFGSDYKVKRTEFYSAYKSWCEAENMKVQSNKAVYKKIRERKEIGEIHGDKDGYYFTGIGIKN